MIRPAFLVVGLCVGLGLISSADEPKKPQWQRLLAGDDAKKAAKLEDKAVELAAKDDYTGAIKAAEESLALRTKLQGDDHYQTVDLLHDLVALRKIAALPVEKRLEWQKALAGVKEARQLESKAQYADALLKRQTYLKWCREVLGEEHPETATSYNNVANNLGAQKKYTEAQPLFQKALLIRHKVLGERHPDTALSYRNVAENLVDQGKFAEVQPLLQKALDIYRKVLRRHVRCSLRFGSVEYSPV